MIDISRWRQYDRLEKARISERDLTSEAGRRDAYREILREINACVMGGIIGTRRFVPGPEYLALDIARRVLEDQVAAGGGHGRPIRAAEQAISDHQEATV